MEHFRFFLLILLSCQLVFSSEFKSHCRQQLDHGLKVLTTDSHQLVRDERHRMQTEFHAARLALHKVTEGRRSGPINLDATAEACPSPNNTMFTTAPPPVPTTAAPTTVVTGASTAANTGSTQVNGASTTVPVNTGSTTTGGSTTVGASTTAGGSSTSAGGTTMSGVSTPAGGSSTVAGGSSTAQQVSSTPSSLEEEEEREEKEKKFVPSALYVHQIHEDPVAIHLNRLHKFLSQPQKVCDGPPMTDINSLTEHQVYGFFATLAASQPGPFCYVCNQMVDFVEQKLEVPQMLIVDEEEKALNRMLYSHIPSARALCSTIAPGCYDNNNNKTHNITVAIECAKCSLCMTGTNIIQHKILLQKEAVAAFLHFLQASLFHNICAELCPIYQNVNLTLFPNGFTYHGCVNYFSNIYQDIVNFLTIITRPERLCMLELKWCALGETPNIIHCLRELCDEYFGFVPQSTWLCSQIPDSPQQADEFLNIRESKAQQQKIRQRNTQQKRKSHEEL